MSNHSQAGSDLKAPEQKLLGLREFQTAEQQLADEYHWCKLRLAEELLLPKGRAGELWAIQNLLSLVSEAIADSARIPPRIAAFASSALQRIYEGEKADDAFGIKRKRGEKDTRRANRRAFCMADRIERHRKLQDMTLEDAVAEAADHFHASVHTAKSAWKKNYKEARRLIDLELEHFNKIQPPVG